MSEKTIEVVALDLHIRQQKFHKQTIGVEVRFGEEISAELLPVLTGLLKSFSKSEEPKQKK